VKSWLSTGSHARKLYGWKQILMAGTKASPEVADNAPQRAVSSKRNTGN